MKYYHTFWVIFDKKTHSAPHASPGFALALSQPRSYLAYLVDQHSCHSSEPRFEKVRRWTDVTVLNVAKCPLNGACGRSEKIADSSSPLIIKDDGS